MSSERRERYPGYDVLAKRDTPSWNEQTRRVVDRRLAIDPDAHQFFTDVEWMTLKALVDRIVPQPATARAAGPGRRDGGTRKMHGGIGDGYRVAALPSMGEAWRRALAALDAEAQTAHDAPFHALAPDRQDELVRAMQQGRLHHEAWAGMPAGTFFTQRVVTDVVKSYYAHPTAWSEVGFGGPASPRGYVRMDFNRRDPWEAAEAKPGREDEARRLNARVGR